jgi:hypothetical protein
VAPPEEDDTDCRGHDRRDNKVYPITLAAGNALLSKLARIEA